MAPTAYSPASQQKTNQDPEIDLDDPSLILNTAHVDLHNHDTDEERVPTSTRSRDNLDTNSAALSSTRNSAPNGQQDCGTDEVEREAELVARAARLRDFSNNSLAAVGGVVSRPRRVLPKKRVNLKDKFKDIYNNYDSWGGGVAWAVEM